MQIRLSATSIAQFKACPQKFRLAQIEHLARLESADSLRIGSTWHKLFELAADTEAIIVHLNEQYDGIPANKTAEEWGGEREMLLSLFLCYQEYWKDAPLRPIATEKKFELPLIHPRLGLPLSTKSVVVTGRMDQVIQQEDRICVLERKTTGSDIEPGAEYWTLLNKNEQVSIYAMALRRLDEFKGNKGNTLYDVVRKPRHKVSKGETVEQYGERLREVISSEPGKYFQRKEIARTDQELDAFDKELFAVYTAIRATMEGGYWYENSHSCRSPFPCEFIPVCYGPGANNVCESQLIPSGFTRLTVGGK